MNKRGIEKAIEVLRGIYPSQKAIKTGEYDHVADALDDAISSLEHQLTNGWIPCKQILPPQPKENPTLDNKPLEIYLVSVKEEDLSFRAFWNGKNFTDGWNKIDVTAWRPLPGPYKEEII